MLAGALRLVLLLHPNSLPSSDQPQKVLLLADTPDSGMDAAPTVESGCGSMPLAAWGDGSG